MAVLEPMANKSPSSFPPPLGVLWLPPPHPLLPPPPPPLMFPFCPGLRRCGAAGAHRRHQVHAGHCPGPALRGGRTGIVTFCPLVLHCSLVMGSGGPSQNPPSIQRPHLHYGSHRTASGWGAVQGDERQDPLICAFGIPLPRTTLKRISFPPEHGISSRFIGEGCPHHHVPPFTKDGQCLPNATEPAELMDPSP